METEKNNRLVLIGGGGHCKSVLDVAIRSNAFSEIVITDYNIPVNSMILGHRVVGNDDILPELFADGFRNAFITIGSIKSVSRRKNAYLQAKKIGFCFPPVIDPSAVVSAYAVIGEGVYIGKNAVVNAGAVIGSMTIINTGAIIEHDCRIGDFTHIAIGTAICGGVKIGEDVFVGANAAIIQGVEIGAKSIIGAGAVVVSNVNAGTMNTGVPAKEVKILG